MQNHGDVSGGGPEQIRDAFSRVILQEAQGDDPTLKLTQALHAAERLYVLFRLRNQRLDRFLVVRQLTQHLGIAEMGPCPIVPAPAVSRVIANQHGEQLAAVLQLVCQAFGVREIEEGRERLLHGIQRILGVQAFLSSDDDQLGAVVPNQPGHPGEEALFLI